MSILIKGMEMPTSCMACLFQTPYMGGWCSLLNDNSNAYSRRRDCPVVPVPPHGRLIDADALAEDLKRQCEEVFKIDAVSPDDFWITRNQAYNERLWKTWCESFYKYLESRPTIIPAEEGEP